MPNKLRRLSGQDVIKIFNSFGYGVIDKNEWKYNMSDGEMEFLIYHCLNIDPRGNYWVRTDAPVSNMEFMVRNAKEVIRFNDSFLWLYNIRPSLNHYSKKRKMQMLDFHTREIEVISVVGGNESKKLFFDFDLIINVYSPGDPAIRKPFFILSSQKFGIP